MDLCKGPGLLASIYDNSGETIQSQSSWQLYLAQLLCPPRPSLYLAFWVNICL